MLAMAALLAFHYFLLPIFSPAAASPVAPLRPLLTANTVQREFLYALSSEDFGDAQVSLVVMR